MTDHEVPDTKSGAHSNSSVLLKSLNPSVNIVRFQTATEHPCCTEMAVLVFQTRTVAVARFAASAPRPRYRATWLSRTLASSRCGVQRLLIGSLKMQAVSPRVDMSAAAFAERPPVSLHCARESISPQALSCASRSVERRFFVVVRSEFMQGCYPSQYCIGKSMLPPLVVAADPSRESSKCSKWQNTKRCDRGRMRDLSSRHMASSRIAEMNQCMPSGVLRWI